MSIILFKTIATFLVIYGLIDLCTKFLSLFTCSDDSKKEIFIFIHVRNQEKSLEYIIRTTIFNYLNSYGGRTVPYMVIVDRGSDDRTEEISRKLCTDYDFLYYATEEEYLNFKNEIK